MTRPKSNIDGRSTAARRLKAAVERLTPRKETAISTALVRRAAKICCSLEDMEDADLRGEPFDAEKHAQMSGTLARLLDRLGINDDDEPERPPIRIPPGWEERLSEDQRSSYSRCQTKDERIAWWGTIPLEWVNEIFIYSGRAPLPQPRPPEPYQPYVPPPPYVYRPPTLDELAGTDPQERERMIAARAKREEQEARDADPWFSDEMRAARRKLEETLL